MSQISIQARCQAERQTHPRGKNLSKDPVQEMRIYWRGALRLVNKLLCDTPSVDSSRDRTALSGEFPEDELKAGREFELRNVLNFAKGLASVFIRIADQI